MANDKKFIVKNGLLTPENAVIGSTTDTGETLQVTGDSVLTQATQGTATLKVKNTGGHSAATIIAAFEGDSDSLQIRNTAEGDYSIINPGQNNSINIADDTAGIVINYAGTETLAFTSTGTDFTGLATTTIEGNRILTTADEGSGNNLDADTVDGLQASQFLRSDVADTAAGKITFSDDIEVTGSVQVDTNITIDGQAVIKALLDAQSNAQIAGSLTVGGDLTVSGNTTYINTEEILLSDNVITLNANYTGSTPSENAGIEIERGTLANPKLVWNEASDYWQLEVNNAVIGRIITTADEGSGNLFDADTVDSLEASQFLRSDVDDTAAGNIIIQGDLTIGDNGGPASIYFDGNGVNRTIYSAAGEIGFLNASANWAMKSDASGDLEVERDVEAGRNVVAVTDVTATAGNVTAGNNVIATAGNVTATVGDVIAGNDVTAAQDITATAGDVTAGNDVTAGQDITATAGNISATVGDVTAGNDVTAGQDITATAGNISATAGSVSAGTTVTAGTDVIGQRFIDADNNSYLVNPAADSTMHAIGIDDDLYHNGDTNTKIAFATDDISLQTGGTERIGIANTRVDIAVDLYAPRLIDTGNNSYFIDPAGSSVLNDIGIDDDIIHNGDTDTKINFGTATINIATDGTTRLTANNSGVTVFGDLDVNGNITAVDGTFSGDVSASRFLDSDDPTYYADPASTSVLNQLSINDYVIHNGDADTFFGFDSNDNIIFTTANVERFEINATNITGTVDGIFPNLFAARFYDAGNATYYADPASTSRLNSIALVGTISHDGDTDTLIHFNTDNSFEIQTGGAQRLLVNNTYVLATNQMRSPIYYDSNDTNYYTNPASTSQMNRIDINDYIRHRGDTDNYFGFPSADSQTFVTGGVERLEIDNAGVTAKVALDSTVSVSAPIFYDSNNVSYYLNPADASLSATLNGAVRIGNITNNSRWSDATGNGGISLSSYGDNGATSSPTIAISGAYAGGYALQYMNRIDPNANPLQNGNRYIHFYADGAAGISLNGDSFNNLYWVLPSGKSIASIDSSANFILTQNENGDVVVGDQSATYSVSDATPLVGSMTNNKLHVNGSIQLNGANDAIVFGTGTSTFLKDEELGFGWGSGLYMTDATYLRIRNNKNVYSQGSYLGNLFYSYQNTAYYLDADGDSQLNTVDIDDYVRHRGDTTTWMGFPAADTIRLTTNNANRVNVTNSAIALNNPTTISAGTTALSLRKTSANAGGIFIEFTDQLTTPTQFGKIGYYHSDSQSFGAGSAFLFSSTETANFVFGQSGGASGGNLIPQVTNTGTLGNATYRWNSAHIGTGNFSGNVTAANMYASRYYDADNNAYYADPAGTSYQQYMNIQVGNEAPGAANASTAGLVMRGNYNSNTWAHKFHKMDHGGGVPIYLSETVGTGAWNAIQRWGTYTGNGYKSQIFGSLAVNTSIYTPIVYDLDNTAYYSNPAGDSKFNEILLDTSNVRLRRPTGSYGSFEVSGGGISGYEGYSINGRSVFMHDGGSVTGIYNDVDNDWFLYGERNSYLRLFHNGTEQARTDSGFFLANNQIRSPIFYDSNNTGYYVDPNNTTRVNAIQALRYYFNHATTYYADAASGDYGSMEVGGYKSGWAGYSIAGQWVLMSNGPERVGIYNDTDNEWSQQWYRNAGTVLYYNGIQQAETASGYFLANNQMRAPIYYDSNNTAYYSNQAAGNTSTAFRTNGIYDRLGFDTSSNGNNNILMRAQDYSHWIWNTAANWGMFWAGNNGAAYQHFGSSNPNELVFVGAGNVRASIDLDDGNAYFQGQVSAGNFALNAGNENISLNPAYGSGGADLVLFDMTPYMEARAIKIVQGAEVNLTGTTGEYVKSDGPFTGSYVLRTAAYRNFYSDYIPVTPGEEIYGEISTRLISGSGGLLYYGVERFDKDKRPIAGNTGTTYFVVGGSNRTSTSWETLRSHTTLPTSHTPYSGSDGGGVHYVRIRILLNYASGGALREFGGIMLKRRNAESNLLVDDLQVLDDVTIGGDLDAAGYGRFGSDVRGTIFYDVNNTNYYVNPAETSRIYNQEMTATNSYLKVGGSGTPVTTRDTNRPIIELGAGRAYPHLTLHSSGSNTTHGGVISFRSANGGGFRRWNIGTPNSAPNFFSIGAYDNNDNPHYGVGVGWTYPAKWYIDFAGNSYSAVSKRAPIFYDLDNTAYYGDFAGQSRLNELRTAGRVVIGGTFENNAHSSVNSTRLHFGGGDSDANGNYYIGTNKENYGGNYTKLDLRWHTGIRMGAQASYGGTRIYNNEDLSTVLFSVGKGDTNVRVENGNNLYVEGGDARATIFYDYNDTNWYANPNGTSRFRDLEVENNGSREVFRAYRTGSAPGNYTAARTINQYGNHSWGIVHEFRIGEPNSQSVASGTDRPAILFSTGYNTTTWSVGFGYTDSDFRIKQDHGHINGSWGTERFRIDTSGNTFVGGGSYGVNAYYNIYYDRNNTAYYGDFAGNSRFNVITPNKVVMASRGDFIEFYGGDSGGYHSISSRNNAGTATDDLRINTYGSVFINLDSNNNNSSSADFRIGRHGAATGSITNLGLFDVYGDALYVYSAYSFRSPIFYDSNNTGYYANMASTSNFNALNVQGALTSNSIYYVDNPQKYDSTSLSGLTNAPISTRNRDYNVGTSSVYLPLTHQTALYSSGYRTHLSTGLYKYPSGWGSGRTGWYAALGGNDSFPTQAWTLTYDAYIQNTQGLVQTTGSFRAPIFYDLNNSGYYMDPASTSYWNTSQQGGYHTFLNYGVGVTGTYTSTRLQQVFAMGSSYRLPADGNSTANMYGIAWSHPNAGSKGGANNLNDHGLLIINNGGFRAAISSRAVFSADVRGTLFYDYNNTGYYVDPASGSQMSSVYANNWFRPQGATGLLFESYGYGIWAPGGGGASYGNVQTYGTGRNGWSGYSIGTRWSIMSSGTGTGNNFGIHDNTRSWMYYFNGSYHAFNYGYGQFESSVRAPVFYDSNDTTYYYNPNSTSNAAGRQRGGTLYGPNPSWGQYLAVGTNGHWTGSYASVAATNGNLHLDARSGYSIYLNNYVGGQTYNIGNFYSDTYYDRNNTSYYGNFASVSNFNDVRANITYDRNNTAYYFGSGSGDSRFNTTRMTEAYTDGWFRNYNAGRGLYNQATARHFYSAGSTYWHMDGNSSVGGLILYDRYNASQGSGTGRRGYLYYDSSGFGLLHSAGGWALRTTNGSSEHYGISYMNDARAYIYYDRNNTAYYFDGASTNSTRFEGVSARTKAHMAISGQTRSSAEYYMARPRITGDTNYWTGSMGWSRIDMNTVANWGSGFIDSWSNPANQPSGTSHWVGTQAYHYSNGSSRYGWQMVGGPIENLRFRSTWGGFRAWRTIPVLDVNNGNAGAMYAGIYYDANNAGYYANPASTSRLNAVTANIFNSPYPGGNSGLTRSSYPYSWGFQEGGAWVKGTVFQYHTGLTFAANAAYGGMRFMTDYNNSTVNFQVNGSSNYTYANTWLQVGGGGVGIYDPYNGAHFLPNNQTSYTPWTVYGNRSGWYGLAFSQSGYDPHLMFDGGGNGGIYYQGLGRWQQYHSIGNNCTGFGSSATRSGYRVQINGSLWATGNVVAYSDRRKKENIETIENALLKVLQLRGVTYTRILEEHNDERDDSFQGLQMGMIAQEVEEIVPEVVSYDAESDEYGLDYPKMVGLLVESIKDQHAIVEAQKEIINNQQKDIDILKEMVYNIQIQMMEK